MSTNVGAKYGAKQRPMTIAIDATEGPLTMRLNVKVATGLYVPSVQVAEHADAMLRNLLLLIEPMPSMEGAE